MVPKALNLARYFHLVASVLALATRMYNLCKFTSLLLIFLNKTCIDQTRIWSLLYRPHSHGKVIEFYDV